MSSHLSRHWVAWVVGGALAAACGGKVEVDDTSSGAGAIGNTGSGASAAAGGTGASATGGLGAGPSGCSEHTDCDAGQVCLFSTGECTNACMPLGGCDGCQPGQFCDGCGTSSCPGCKDCTAACVPIQPGQCDENDPCPDGSQCIWSNGQCQPVCGPGGQCPFGLTCESCVTGSCCGCDDCVDVCVEIGALWQPRANRHLS